MLKTATVLVDNEYRKPRFLTALGELGSSVHDGRLCMMPTVTKIFRYDIFGLMTSDKKLADYLKVRDGIIIVVDHTKISQPILDRIDATIKGLPDKLIMIVVERDYGQELKMDPIKLFSKYEKPNVKTFFVDHTANNYFDVAKDWFNSCIQSVKQGEQRKLTSVTIPIQDMVRRFEENKMPLELWDHYGRLRIVHYSLVTYGFNATINPKGWLCTNWIKYKESIGHGNLWHYTLTRFWTNILYNLYIKYGYKTFDEMYKSHPKIQQGCLFKEYYSDDVLFTDIARTSWVKPNLK